MNDDDAKLGLLLALALHAGRGRRMTESEWMVSTDPAAMLRHLRQEDVETGGVYGRGWRWVDRETPLISDRQLRAFEDACFAMFGLNLDDVATQEKPVASAAHLLRDIVGNPFRDLRLDRCETPWCGGGPCDGSPLANWFTPLVRQLAEAAYTETGRVCEQCVSGWTAYGQSSMAACENCHGTGRLDTGTLDPDRLLILADALFEAGCPEGSEIVMHLRGNELCPTCIGSGWFYDDSRSAREGAKIDCPDCESGWVLLRGPHIKGCWAVSLLREETQTSSRR